MMVHTLANTLASTFQAYLNCKEKPETHKDWEMEHRARIEDMCKDLLPSGSGIDNGTSFDFHKSTPEKLVLYFDFHHMNENGVYDGWTGHNLTVTASLVSGLNLKISGRNRNDIKDYLYETYDHILGQLVSWDGPSEAYRFQKP